jgi:hypothetical protein
MFGWFGTLPRARHSSEFKDVIEDQASSARQLFADRLSNERSNLASCPGLRDFNDEQARSGSGDVVIEKSTIDLFFLKIRSARIYDASIAA